MNFLFVNRLFLFALSILFVHASVEARTVVYVSESGHNRIGIFSLDESKEELTRIGDIKLEGSPGPLAMSADRKHLYASLRTAGKFATLKVDPASGLLSFDSSVPSAGSAAYIFPDRSGRWLLAAYYSEGLVSVSRINEDGIIVDEPLWVLDIGPKAHCIQVDPANRFAFCPHPMDLNCVDQFLFDPESGELTLNTPPSMPGAPGAGPRHLQFHPNGKWVYVVNEQGKSVSFCQYDAEKGLLSIQQTLSTHPAGWDSNKGSCADIEITLDGKFLYASNRGHESIAGFSIHPETGILTALGQTPTEKTPRSFNLMPGEKYLVVAGQGEGRIALYRRDAGSGALTPLQTLDCGKSPAWVMGVELP
ncbi:MAG TPA: lactonase family protein [Verrucomicrobiales bacterium]|nr:lactonase family protein [Verrucomicrobiales bacterium]